LQNMPPSEAAAYHLEVARQAAEAGLPPVLIAANLECGLVYTLGSGGTHLPYPLGLGFCNNEAVAYRAALIGAREARTVGFHWTFSPCVDVLATDSDPIIGLRGFGADPEKVSRLGAAQIRGIQDGGMAATAKHFPGHGDAETDSHLGLPRVSRTAADHDAVHLAPFRAAIQAGVATIMTAHVVLPTLGVNSAASLDKRVHEQWLRRDLGFQGVVVSDSLRMGGVANNYTPAEATVIALAAGADVANVKSATEMLPEIVARVVAAVESGELAVSRLDHAVRRVLTLKARLGLHEAHGIDLKAARRLDEATTWQDPERRRTVKVVAGSTALPIPKRAGSVRVIGNGNGAAALAARLQHRLRRPIHFTDTASPAAAVAEFENGDSEETQIVAVRPSLPATPEDVAALNQLLSAPRLDALVVLGLVPPALTRSRSMSVPIVCAPAVDAFDVVTNAAIAAAVDVLFDPPAPVLTTAGSSPGN
jgi:beta-N-acetylhexosaminidase